MFHENPMPAGAAETASPHFTSLPNYDDDTDVIDRMVGVILERQREGQPTHWNDLKDFTPSEIGAHWPKACERANRVTFRNIGADELEPDYRPQRLTEAADLVASMIPDRVQIGAALRAGGFAADEQRAIWDGLMARLKPKARALLELASEPEAR